MIDTVWRKITEESYIFHICDGDCSAFVSILSIVILLGIFLYKKRNKKEDTLIYLLLLIYGVFIIALGYDMASLLWVFLLFLCTVWLSTNTRGVVDRFVFFIQWIDEKIGLHVRLKTTDELHEGINNKKKVMLSVTGIYFAIIFVNCREFFSDCFKFDYCTSIIVWIIGLGSYIVFMYNFLSKTKCWMLVLGVNILIGIHIIFTMYDLLNSNGSINMFVLAVQEILFNLFMIGIIGVMLIYEIMNLEGDEKSKYFKILIYTTLGYGILKVFFEFSFSYYIYYSMIAAIKNVIDSTLQVCFLGSLFAYAGIKLSKTSNDYLDK